MEMKMKVNSHLIKRLREERSWSQEHLASVAELSLRTIQRIETEGSASPESRMALASALNIDVASLSVSTDRPATSALPPDGGAKAQTVTAKNRFAAHVAVYLTVCAALVFFDFVRHGAITWSKWPFIGWGIGLLFRWVKRRGSANTRPA